MSLKKAKDYLGNDLQVDSALKDGKGQVIHKTYINKTIPDGTIAKNIGVDSNGDIVKETPSGGGGTQLYKHQLTITSEGGDTNLILSFINNVSTSYSGSVLVFTPLIICDGWVEGEFDEGNDSIYGVVTHFEIYENNFNSNFTVKGFFEIGSAGNVFTWNGALGIGSSIITDVVTPL